MNNPHKNARTTPLGRAEMVRRIVEEGRPAAEVAAGFGISERTARKWVAAGGRTGLRALRTDPRGRIRRIDNACLCWRDAGRTAAPGVPADRGGDRGEAAAWPAPPSPAGSSGIGLGRLSAIEPKAPVRRYQRERPANSSISTSRSWPVSTGVGHRITGNRRGASQGMGYDFSTSPSTMPRGWPMSRSCRTSGAGRRPAS